MMLRGEGTTDAGTLWRRKLVQRRAQLMQRRRQSTINRIDDFNLNNFKTKHNTHSDAA